MSRAVQLNDHLRNLLAANVDGAFGREIAEVVQELHSELGVGQPSNLSNYSKEELYEALVKHNGVRVASFSDEDEVTLEKHVGTATEAVLCAQGSVKVLFIDK